MQCKIVSVLGGSGFVGSAVVAKLSAAGYSIKVLTRRRDTAKHLLLLPNVQAVECNVLDYQALNSALRGSDAVINLIGVLHQNRRNRFNTMHHQLPAQLAKICADLGIKRLLHMSSLGADKNAPSEYLRSKAAGEAALTTMQNKLNITVFKPSVIFGTKDSFINLFAKLIKRLPIILLAKPNAKFQPIWVEDVARCFVASLENTATYRQTYELAGSKIYTLRELVQLIMQTLGKNRPIFGLNNTFSMLQAWMLECLPMKLMSRDNIRSMAVDSVSHAPFSSMCNRSPTALEAILPETLIDQTPRGGYDRFRQTAAR